MTSFQGVSTTEAKWAPYGHVTTVGIEGLQVSGAALLQSFPSESKFEVGHKPKKQAKAAPAVVYLLVLAKGRFERQLGFPGSFAFSFVPSHTPASRLQCIDAISGLPVPLDSRIWTDCVISVGSPPPADGVSDGAVMAAAPLIPCDEQTCMLSPLAADVLRRMYAEDLLHDGIKLPITETTRHMVMVFAVDGHWACLGLTLGSDLALRACYYDGLPDRVASAALQLAQAVAYAGSKPLQSFQQARLVPQQHADDGAVIALVHAACFVLRKDQPPVELVAAITQRVASHAEVPGLLSGTGGLSEEQLAQLRRILLDRGGPSKNVDERMQQAVSRVGAGPLIEACLTPRHNA